MAENEWFHELQSLRATESDRKARLFAVACCRRVWAIMTDPHHRIAVEAAERLADGVLTETEFESVLSPVVRLWASLPPASTVEWESWHYLTGATRHLSSPGEVLSVASYASRSLARIAGIRESSEWIAARNEEWIAQRELIRDIVGPMPQPIPANPSWRTDTTLALARQMYESRDFGAMPILADALQDAGCDNEGILSHCRDANATHVRGCWVVDLVLGKS